MFGKDEYFGLKLPGALDAGRMVFDEGGMITIGIDCGTQSTKVVALDWECGQVVADGGGTYGFVEGLGAGEMEQHPEWWVAAAQKGISEVLAALGSRKQAVRAIGVSGQQHGLVVLDAEDRVVRPAKLWCDTSTADECEEITHALGGRAAVIQEVGNSMRAGYTAPKIRWLAKREPNNWERTRTVLLPHDYLNFWLSGEKRMEYGDASGTGLMNIWVRAWSQRACDAVDEALAAKLPHLGSSARPVGRLRESLRREWGLPSHPLVSAGGGDNMMAAVGTGNTKKGVVTCSLGTSGTIFSFSDHPVVDLEGEVAGFCDSTDNWLPLVCTMNLTLVTEHVRTIFGWTHEQMDEAVQSVHAGAGGLVMLPYLTGERTPDLPRARGFLAGLTFDNMNPATLARCAVESVVIGLAYGLERLRGLGVEVATVRLTGGASKSPVWKQICADIFGVPVMALDSSRGAALGAAIHAGWTHLMEQGETTCIAEICDKIVDGGQAHPVVEPKANQMIYRELAEKSGLLRRKLIGAGLLE